MRAWPGLMHALPTSSRCAWSAELLFTPCLLPVLSPSSPPQSQWQVGWLKSKGLPAAGWSNDEGCPPSMLTTSGGGAWAAPCALAAGCWLLLLHLLPGH